jgi:hypothetical protein
MEVKLKLESQYWLRFLSLLKQESYIYDLEILSNDGKNAVPTYFNVDLSDNLDNEADYTELPPEREALLHLSDWDDDSLNKIEQARLSLNQLAVQSW